MLFEKEGWRASQGQPTWHAGVGFELGLLPAVERPVILFAPQCIYSESEEPDQGSKPTTSKLFSIASIASQSASLTMVASRWMRKSY